jgi:hypothetical protein
MVEIISVEQAVGRILFHDITRIAPGEFKGRAFKKGHHIAPGRRAEAQGTGQGPRLCAQPD